MGESSERPSPALEGSTVDHFAALQQPRLPWLEPETLKAKFLELSSQTHPDRVHGGSQAEKELATRRHAEINAAYRCLSEPKERLGHLLALEHGVKPTGIESVPEDATELFFKIGRLCRDVDGFLGGRAKDASSSPLLKVRRFKEALDWTEQVQARLGDLQERWAVEENQLKNLNAEWSPGRPALAECERSYRRLSYLSRWLNQLREKQAQLSLE
jgi:curved DNA-binding protein CbpA